MLLKEIVPGIDTAGCQGIANCLWLSHRGARHENRSCRRWLLSCAYAEHSPPHRFGAGLALREPLAC